MKKDEVPQDRGFSDGVREISYAVDENGRYVLVQSRGWEPKTVANDQAWEVIEEDLREQIRLIRSGKRSPLAYHMTRNLMDIGLLSSYADLPRWRVRRHLKPKVFRRLSAELKARYAGIFGITVAQLHEVPETAEINPHE
ncbi:MAG: hypothetical protein ACOC23_01570 [Thermodesulfobacteriota bacterium]